MLGVHNLMMGMELVLKYTFSESANSVFILKLFFFVIQFDYGRYGRFLDSDSIMRSKITINANNGQNE